MTVTGFEVFCNLSTIIWRTCSERSVDNVCRTRNTEKTKHEGLVFLCKRWYLIRKYPQEFHKAGLRFKSSYTLFSGNDNNNLRRWWHWVVDMTCSSRKHTNRAQNLCWSGSTASVGAAHESPSAFPKMMLFCIGFCMDNLFWTLS